MRITVFKPLHNTRSISVFCVLYFYPKEISMQLFLFENLK